MIRHLATFAWSWALVNRRIQLEDKEGSSEEVEVEVEVRVKVGEMRSCRGTWLSKPPVNASRHRSSAGQHD
jgi:hypothetical protein